MEHRDIDKMCREIRSGKNVIKNSCILDGEIKNLSNNLRMNSLEKNVVWYLKDEINYMDNEFFQALTFFIEKSNPRLEEK
ncbi:MAG: hypothetical protein WA061_02755 [Microgenomates group bacterium]